MVSSRTLNSLPICVEIFSLKWREGFQSLCFFTSSSSLSTCRGVRAVDAEPAAFTSAAVVPLDFLEALEIIVAFIEVAFTGASFTTGTDDKGAFNVGFFWGAAPEGLTVTGAAWLFGWTALALRREVRELLILSCNLKRGQNITEDKLLEIGKCDFRQGSIGHN